MTNTSERWPKQMNYNRDSIGQHEENIPNPKNYWLTVSVDQVAMIETRRFGLASNITVDPWGERHIIGTYTGWTTNVMEIERKHWMTYEVEYEWKPSTNTNMIDVAMHLVGVMEKQTTNILSGSTTDKGQQ